LQEGGRVCFASFDGGDASGANGAVTDESDVIHKLGAFGRCAPALRFGVSKVDERYGSARGLDKRGVFGGVLVARSAVVSPQQEGERDFEDKGKQRCGCDDSPI